MRRLRHGGDTVRDRDTTKIRLGLGDYRVDGPNVFARMCFLRAIERCVPDVLSELVEIARGPQRTEAATLRAWAEKRGFSGWLFDHASQTVAAWRDNPQRAGRWLVSAAIYVPPAPPAPSWDPTGETEPAFRRRVEEYIEAVKAAPGLVETPTKNTGFEHFEWLALHVVAGWDYASINEKYANEDGTPDTTTISRGITETAQLLGVTLPRKRGRGSRPKVAVTPAISTQ